MATCDIDTLIADATTNKFTQLEGRLADAVRLQLLCDLKSQVGPQGNLVKVLDVQNTSVAHTGNTDETTLFTATLPAGTLGPNGFFRVTCTLAATNNANSKLLRFRLGGAELVVPNLASGASVAFQRTTSNRNSEASQITFGPNTVGSFAGMSGSANRVTSVDTSLDQDITVTVQLSNAGDTVTLEQAIVEYAYMP